MLRRGVPLLLLALLLVPSVSSYAQTSTVESRDITVYTRDIAEIQEVRTVELDRGRNLLRLYDIAPGILEGSVIIEAVDTDVSTHAIGFTAFDFDMEVYWKARIGEKIEVETRDGDEEYEGILRMVQDDKLFLQEKDDPEQLFIVDRDNIDETKLENIAKHLSTEPSLAWDYETRDRGETKIRLTYLTEGLHWRGEHRVVLEEDRAAVIANAVAVNEAGMTLHADRISFIGGNIHLAGDRRQVDRLNPKPGAMAGGTGSRFGDMRRWTVDDAELLADHNTRLMLFSDNTAGVERSYIYDATIFDDRVSAHVEFSLGDALPYGDVRVYQINEGESMFIGEDRVDDTPPGSPVDLNVGQVFDITAERTRLSEGRADTGNTTQTFEVKLGNSGAETITVRVLERMFGDWSIPSANLNGNPIEMEKVDARTAAFDVPVPAGQTVTLTYEIIYER